MNCWPRRASSVPSRGLGTRFLSRKPANAGPQGGQGERGRVGGRPQTVHAVCSDCGLPCSATIGSIACEVPSSSVVSGSAPATHEPDSSLPRKRRQRNAPSTLVDGCLLAALCRGVRSSVVQVRTPRAASPATSSESRVVMPPTLIVCKPGPPSSSSGCKQSAAPLQTRRFEASSSARGRVVSHRCSPRATSFHAVSRARSSRPCCSNLKASCTSCFFSALSRSSSLSYPNAHTILSRSSRALPSSTGFFFSSLPRTSLSFPSVCSSSASTATSDSDSSSSVFGSPTKSDKLPPNVLGEFELLHLIKTMTDRRAFLQNSRTSSTSPCPASSTALPHAASSRYPPRWGSSELFFPAFFVSSLSFHVRHSPHILFSVLHLYSSSPSLPPSPLLETLRVLFQTQPELPRRFSAKELSVCLHALARLLRNVPPDRRDQSASRSPVSARSTRLRPHSWHSSVKTEQSVWLGHPEGSCAARAPTESQLSPPPVEVTSGGAITPTSGTQNEPFPQQKTGVVWVGEVDSWKEIFRTFEESFVSQLIAQFNHSLGDLNKRHNTRFFSSSPPCSSPVSRPRGSLFPSALRPTLSSPWSSASSPGAAEESRVVPGPRLARLKEHERFFAARDPSSSPSFSGQQRTTSAAVCSEARDSGCCSVNARSAMPGIRRRGRGCPDIPSALDELAAAPPHLVVPQDLSMFLSSLLSLRRPPSPSLLFAGCCYIYLYLQHIPPHGLTLIAYNISRSVSSASPSAPFTSSSPSFPSASSHEWASVSPPSSSAAETFPYSLLLEPRLGPFSMPSQSTVAQSEPLYSVRGLAPDPSAFFDAAPSSVSHVPLSGSPSSVSFVRRCSPSVPLSPGASSSPSADTSFRGSGKGSQQLVPGVSSAASSDKLEGQKARQPPEGAPVFRCSALQLLTSALEVGMLQKVKALRPADWCCGLQALNHLLHLQVSQPWGIHRPRTHSIPSRPSFHLGSSDPVDDHQGIAAVSSATGEQQATQFLCRTGLHRAAGTQQAPTSSAAEAGAEPEKNEGRKDDVDVVTSAAATLVEFIAEVHDRRSLYSPASESSLSLSPGPRVETDSGPCRALKDCPRSATLSPSSVSTCLSIRGILSSLIPLLDHLYVQLKVFPACSLPQIALALVRLHKAVSTCFRSPTFFSGGQGQKAADLAPADFYFRYLSSSVHDKRGQSPAVDTVGNRHDLKSKCTSHVATPVSVSSQEASQGQQSNGTGYSDSFLLTRIFASLYVQVCTDGKGSQRAVASLPPSSKVILLSSVVEGLCLVRSTSSRFSFVPSLPAAASHGFSAAPPSSGSTSSCTSSSSLVPHDEVGGCSRGEKSIQHRTPSVLAASDGELGAIQELGDPRNTIRSTTENSALSLFSSVAPSLLSEDLGSQSLDVDSPRKESRDVCPHREDGYSDGALSSLHRYRLAWEPKPQDLIDLLSATTTLFSCLQERCAPVSSSRIRV